MPDAVKQERGGGAHVEHFRNSDAGNPAREQIASPAIQLVISVLGNQAAVAPAERVGRRHRSQGFLYHLIRLIGAAPEIMAAQDQWVKIIAFFPDAAAQGERSG